MGKPSASLPSFSNFAKIFSPFFQRALCFFIEFSERSEGQDDEPPMMIEVATQDQKEALPQGLVPVLCLSLSLLSLSFFLFLP